MNCADEVVVLKQVCEGYAPLRKSVGGIVRLETEDGATSLHLSIINVLPSDGEDYRLYFSSGKNKVVYFPLGKRPSFFRKTFDLPYEGKGFSAGLVHIADGIPTVFAFARTENGTPLPDFRKTITDACIQELSTEKASKTAKDGSNSNAVHLQKTPSENTPPERNPRADERENDSCREEPPTTTENVCEEYDDEVVATENYFENNDDFAEKLKKIKEFDNDGFEDALHDCGNKKENESGEKAFESLADEESFGGSEEYSESNPYFRKVKNELENLFDSFPKEQSLERSIPKSRWARVSFSADKYYVVGVVSENGKEKYVCYGIPSEYKSNPPKELDGFCSFVPSSVFDMCGKGYYMMFQDAVTGECVKLNDSGKEKS